MAEPPLDPGSSAATDIPPEPGSTTGTPRWVKAFGIVVLVAILLLAILLLVGGGDHGPGRH